MENIAVIVENRPSVNIKKVIAEHSRFLPGWQILHISHPITSGSDYNQFLTTKEFWIRFEEYYRVLIFQQDSMLMRLGIEEFLEWDYVGAPWRVDAPWARRDRKGGNGGLSLRNPRMMISVLDKFAYNESRHGNEDVFFVHHLDQVGGKLAPYEVCKKFSCETVPAMGTLGYHAIDKHFSQDQYKQIATQYVSIMS